MCFRDGAARAGGAGSAFCCGRTCLPRVSPLPCLVRWRWAVTVPAWPGISARHFQARRRWKLGRCTACKYDLRGNPKDVTNCPECGTAQVEPEPYRFTPSIFRRFIIINVLAWVAGSVSGELWIRADEAAFLQEIIVKVAQGEESHRRARYWPGVGELIWSQEAGIRTGVQHTP